MKLTRFAGKGIRGFRDIEFCFNEDVNFLIGENGSCKTTLLRLLKGLIVPSIKDLVAIEYKSIVLEFSFGGNDTGCISTKKENDILFLRIEMNYKGSVVNEEEAFDITELNNAIAQDKLDKYLDGCILISYIREYFGPYKYIPTDRMVRLGYKSIDSNNLIPYLSRNKISIDELSTTKLALLSFFADAKDIQLGIERRKVDFYKSFDREMSMMSFDFQPIDTNDHKDYVSELSLLNTKLSKLEESHGFDLVGKQEYAKIVDFLTAVQGVLQVLATTNENSSDFVNNRERWNTYLNQLYRSYRIVDLMERFSSGLDNLKNPMQIFEDAVNHFFVQTGKQFQYNKTRDEFEIKIDGVAHPLNVLQLSSGEEQLLILLAQMKFESFYSYIAIDEPELSMHLRWQDDFVTMLQNINPEAQYIIATHSPAIVAGRENCCFDLTPEPNERD